ncbi:hypothetical protein PF011_g2008 [Phytophthora fragariae]|uniref:Uncharacterized protein n=1 Tax=Phytophthora fragariae TaxID=53985 RepID=A0A6A3M6B9_9STRA|nr:hypothetical protein PF011_g2008 [Phytophthora fragariae]
MEYALGKTGAVINITVADAGLGFDMGRKWLQQLMLVLGGLRVLAEQHLGASILEVGALDNGGVRGQILRDDRVVLSKSVEDVAHVEQRNIFVSLKLFRRVLEVAQILL